MKRFALVGHPLGHSVSPAMHRAAYAALGVEAAYHALDCADELAVRDVVGRLRTGELAGLNVTIPYKRLALELADRVDAIAESAGVANVLERRDGSIVAHNTDVTALVERFAELRPGTRRFGVLGSGGAALAAVRAAVEVGADRVAVTARRFPEASAFERLGAELFAWDDDRALAGSEIVVQATSAGMRGADPGEAVATRVPWAELAPGAVALDVVYNPRVTPFLAAARAAGLACEGGLPMLVGQAARAIEIWLGQRPAPHVLSSAAERALEAA